MIPSPYVVPTCDNVMAWVDLIDPLIARPVNIHRRKRLGKKLSEAFRTIRQQQPQPHRYDSRELWWNFAIDDGLADEELFVKPRMDDSYISLCYGYAIGQELRRRLSA